MIACLPTYESIGSWAPALLLIARLFQGLSVGGEYGTSATYMSEVAIKGRRGFYASFQYVTLIGGQLLALLVLVALQQILSAEELKAWGWVATGGSGVGRNHHAAIELASDNCRSGGGRGRHLDALGRQMRVSLVV